MRNPISETVKKPRVGSIQRKMGMRENLPALCDSFDIQGPDSLPYDWRELHSLLLSAGKKAVKRATSSLVESHLGKMMDPTIWYYNGGFQVQVSASSEAYGKHMFEWVVDPEDITAEDEAELEVSIFKDYQSGMQWRIPALKAVVDLIKRGVLTCKSTERSARKRRSFLESSRREGKRARKDDSDTDTVDDFSEKGSDDGKSEEENYVTPPNSAKRESLSYSERNINIASNQSTPCRRRARVLESSPESYARPEPTPEEVSSGTSTSNPSSAPDAVGTFLSPQTSEKFQLAKKVDVLQYRNSRLEKDNQLLREQSEQLSATLKELDILKTERDAIKANWVVIEKFLTDLSKVGGMGMGNVLVAKKQLGAFISAAADNE